MPIVMKRMAALASFLAAVSLVGLIGSAHAASRTSHVGDSQAAVRHALVRPVVAIIEADWCPTCQMMKPTIAKLMKDVDNRAEFVTLDVTDDSREEASERLARKFGISGFFRKYESQTSTVGIFAPHSTTPSEVLVGQGDESPYLAALAPWIGKGRKI